MRKTVNIEKIRRLIADYMRSEGCSCCRNNDAHKENKRKLAELLEVPKYDDGSGYNFSIFCTNQP